MKELATRLLLASTLLLVTSCGYAPLAKRYDPMHATCVVHGSDGMDGRLLPTLQRVFLEYDVYTATDMPEYTIHIELGSDDIEQIGFQYDVNPRTQAQVNRLVPNEERRRVTADVWVERNGAVVLDRQTVQASAQYDFVDPDSDRDVVFTDVNGQQVTTLDFSLGQLDAQEGARFVSDDVVTKNLARQIAELIANSPL